MTVKKSINGKPRKVIIVEDDAVAVMLLRKNLQNWQHQVIADFDTAEELLEKLPYLEPDLILMDIMLKGKKNGIQAVNEIHTDRSISIIYITASEDPETLKAMEKTNYKALISKPYHPTQIRDILNQIQ